MFFLKDYRDSAVKRIMYFSTIILLLSTVSVSAKQDDTKSTSLVIECFDIEIFYSENGLIKYKLQSSRVDKLEDKSVKLPGGGTITCYDDKGEIEFIAHADSAYSSANNKMWIFEGDVFIDAKDIHLESQSLSWDRDNKIISTEDLVQITNSDSSITGNGLTAKQDLSYYEIGKPKGSVAIE